MPIGPLQYGTYHMIKKPLRPKNLVTCKNRFCFLEDMVLIVQSFESLVQ
jgi:hypothetical protein